MSSGSDKGTLPYGWVVKTSKKYKDRVYYFNMSTGASTWECPELDPPSNEKALRKAMEEIIGCKPVNSSKDNSKSPEEKRVSKHDNFSGESKIPPTAVVVPVMSNSSFNNKKEQRKKRKLEDEKRIEKTPSTSVEKIDRKKAKRKKKEKLGKSNSANSIALDDSKDALGKIDDIKNSSLEKSLNSSCTSEINDDIKDVEMKDVSLELDDLNAKTELDASACYYIVVDTNVLIRELHLISELKDTPLDGCGPPHIFIPWVVIEELDKLKNQQKNNAKGPWRAAAEAIRYLNSVLKNHPRFHGQSPAEAEEWSKSYSKNNDDKILECCIALSDKMPPEKVLLLTNDKNLVNKAYVSKINAFDFEGMMQRVKPDTVFVYNDKKKEKEKKLESSDASTGTPPEVAQQRFLRRSLDIHKNEIHNLMSNARMSLKDVLLKFLEIEMFEAYGDTWKLFPIEKNLLKGILEAIKKYWKMVFSEFFTVKDQRNFELLLEKAKRPEGFMGEKDDCLVILSTIEDVFRQIQKRAPTLRVPVDKIKKCRLACVQAFMKYNESEVSLLALEEKDTFDLFNANWICINQLTGLILDYYNIPNNFDYVKFDGRLPEAEVQRILITLLPEVECIKTLMSNLLDASKNGKPMKNSAEKLAKRLLNFIPSLQVPHEPVTYPNFSKKALERFFLNPQHREMLETGIKQADDFHKKLDEVLNSLLMCKIGNRDTDTMICE